MKIGLVLPGFGADERDWCIPALLNFVRRLAVDHSVHVFALEYPYRRDLYSVSGATVHSMNGQNRGKREAPRLWSRTMAAIWAEHRRARFDVLHAFWVNKPGALAVLAGRTLGIPVVVSVAGGELAGIRGIRYGGQLEWLERTMVRAVLRAADRVTVGSRYLQRLAAGWRTDACILPLGVDAQRFSPSEDRTPNGSFKVLNVGSLVPVKQQARLLNALAQLERRDACLEIVGSGMLEAELGRRADALGVADRVAFSGAIPHDAMAARYRMADLFVQSSLHEAQGMAVLEAAACGMAIAGTPVGILPELAEAGGAVAARGFAAEDLAEAMASAWEARAELGQNARRAIERRFAVEATWTGWKELYQVRRAWE